MTVTREDALIWLRKEIHAARDNAVTHRIIACALAPQMARFATYDSADDPMPSMYAIRTAVEHQTTADQSEMRAIMMAALLQMTEAASDIQKLTLKRPTALRVMK